MGLRDRRDDSEPETRSAAASLLVGTAEALEGAGYEGGWEPTAFVGYVQLQPVAVLRGGDADRAGSVPEGVVDQIAEGLLDAEAVDAGPTASAVAFDRSPGVSGATFEAD